MRLNRSLLRVAVVAAVVAITGCESRIFHDLQPHRLWRLNRQPAPGRGALYSVSDRIPAAETTAANTPLSLSEP